MPGMAVPATGVAAPPAATPAAVTPPAVSRPAATPRLARPPSADQPAPSPAAASPVFTGNTGVFTAPNPAETAGWPSPVQDNALRSFLTFEILEYQHAPNVRAGRWDAYGWYGGDIDRIWIKSEGRYNGVTRTGDMDVQLLYGRLIFPFIDFQAGVRYEQQLSADNGLGRGFAVIGLQGLVPFGMELEAAIFLSQSGDLSVRGTLIQDFLLTQRLILQPRFEFNAALQSVSRYGVGAGLNDIEVGLRLRYEVLREVAPYVGVSWLKSFGETATLRSAGGENASAFQLVAGVRLWF